MGTQICYLRCEYLINPLGIDALQPRLSWQLISDRRGTIQSAYQIRATGENDLLWDTGKVLSGQSTHLPYDGPALRSGQCVTWQVRAWDGDNQPSEWSESAGWEMGLLKPADWTADWIEPGWDEDPKAFKPCPYLRRGFKIEQPVVSARLYITSHGLYEAWINGRRVGDQVFTPGYTSYPERLQYQVYDVTSLLQPGENAIGAVLGDGWFRGKILGTDLRNVYGARLGLLAQLVIRLEDGSQRVIASGPDWKAKTGPILKSDMKDGEIYDARLEMPGWNAPGYDDAAWQKVKAVSFPKNNMVAAMGASVRKMERFTPTAILMTPNGETVVDMGQNLAGVVMLKVSGPAGTVVKLRHGETLDKAGNFTMANLTLPLPGGGQLWQETQYILKGDEEEFYEPHFTVHGFRYVKVEGFPGQVTPDALTGIAIYSDMTPTGAFDCSDPLINQLHHNIEWSQKGNFLDIPTDCPTRERAGWTGDSQIFVRTGSYLMDTAPFFIKWLKDLKTGQYPNGMVGNFVPNPFWPKKEGVNGGTLTALEGSSGWGDAAVILPWTLYLTFGDRRILEEQYASMKAWVDYERARARKMNWSKYLNPSLLFDAKRRERQAWIWDTNYHWGEWLEPEDANPAKAFTGVIKRMFFGEPVVATAYLAYSSQLLAEAARVLGKDEDCRGYSELSAQVKAAYTAEFIGADGRIKPDKQASYVRALAFELAPEPLRPALVDHLVRLIKASGTHIGTGFLSTPFLCHVLSENGHLPLAYDLLNQKTIPSWLYSVTKGATTIWENWEGIKTDGSPNGSLNHYSYGAVGGWLHRVVAGIEIEEPGYKRIRISPHPGGGLTRARASFRSMYGEIESAWEITGEDLTIKVTIPANTTAAVYLPDIDPRRVTENGHPLATTEGITGYRQDNNTTVIEIGSGTYLFRCQNN